MKSALVPAHVIPNSWRSLWLGCTVLIFAVSAAYFPAICSGYIWDDDAYVYRNPTLPASDGLTQIWLNPTATPQYYPLVHSMFWVEYRLWGLSPTGYHAVNVLLHGLNAILVWRLFAMLRIPAAFFCAAVFALHPVHVESVAWITERKNTLSLFFYLVSATCFLSLFIPEKVSNHRTEAFPSVTASNREWILRLAASYLFFVAAMLSKTVSVTLPAALLLVIWQFHGRIRVREIVAVSPMFLIGLPWGFFTAALERTHVGAVGTEWDISFVDRFLIAGRALWFYSGKLVFPHPLMFIYPRWRIDSEDWRMYFFVLAAIGVVAVCFVFRRRVGRGPITGILYFAGTLFPALSFFNIYPMRYSFVADHFQYAASLGIIAIAVGSMAFWASRCIPQRTTVLLATLGLLALASLTWRQCLIYQDQEVLWKDTIAKNPSCVMAHMNLGLWLREHGRTTEAFDHFEHAASLAPDDPLIKNHLAMGFLGQRNYGEAKRLLLAAIDAMPDHSEAHANLAVTYMGLGELDDADVEFCRTIDLIPRNPLVRFNYGMLLERKSKLEAAVLQYREALRLDASYVAARFRLGAILIELGNVDEGTAQLQLILQNVPDFAPANELLQELATGNGGGNGVSNQ